MSTESKELHSTEEKGLAKQEAQEERTSAVRTFSPYTDITENGESLIITMDMPGVKKENVDVRLEKNVLEIEGVMDFSPYENLKPVYTEYQVGNYVRRFTISNTIDQENIAASLDDGVLTLTLPKVPEAQPKKIPIN